MQSIRSCDVGLSTRLANTWKLIPTELNPVMYTAVAATSIHLLVLSIDGPCEPHGIKYMLEQSAAGSKYGVHMVFY